MILKASIAFVALVALLFGCANNGQSLTVGEQLGVLQEILAVAEKTSSAVSVHVTIGDRVGLYETAEVGVITPLTIQASFQANAASGREPVDEPKQDE